MIEMKKLPKGMERFIARKVDKMWRVYDKARGSFPYEDPALGGKVLQDVPQADAEAEAARLNGTSDESIELPVIVAEPVAEELPVKEEDIETYDEMTPEEIAKYEEGLLEEVKY